MNLTSIYRAETRNETFTPSDAKAVYKLDMDKGPITERERASLIPQMQKLCKNFPIHRQVQVEVSEEEFLAQTIFPSTRVKRSVIPGGEFECQSLSFR